MNAERLLAHYEKIADAPDAIARLRRFILDLAVRGKLVPQDADEPASELLKRIAKEKAQLDRKERTKREPRSLNGGAQPIQLPEGWALAPLADLVSILNGRAYKQNELLSAGTPVLRVGNLFTSDRWYYSTLELEEDKYCDKGDLIFAWSASFGPFIWTGEKVIYHYHIWKLPLHSEANLNKLYLYNFLLQKTRAIKEAGHGISMIHMTKEKMELIQVPVPPLAEQHRIVAKVDELMGLCDRLEAARAGREAVRDRLSAASLARLNAPDPETFHSDARFALDALPALMTRPDQIRLLRQTILNLAVRGKLVPQDTRDEPASELLKRIAREKARLVGEKKLKRQKELPPIDSDNVPFELCDGWGWSKADNVFLNVTDGFHNTPSPVREGYPYVTAKHIRPNRIDFDNCLYVDGNNHRELFAKTRVKRGDILIVNIGAGCGTAAMVYVDYEFSFKNVAIVNLPSVMDGKFVLLFLLYYRDLVFDELIKGGAQPFLGLGMLREMLVPIPPLAEQNRIVAKVDELMTLCDRLEGSLTAAATTRRRLLDALLAEALTPAAARELEAAE